MTESTCYRHEGVESGIVCQRCDRPICTKCMNQASVGFHCPECVKSSTQKVFTPSTLPGARAIVTRGLITANVVAFVASMALFGATPFGTSGTTANEVGVFSGYVANGDWWRLISSGFFHFGLFHLGMNMYSLWILGRLHERALGERLFAAVYLTSLLGGSLGVVVIESDSLAMGASGAIFGLLGMTIMLFRSRGVGLIESGMHQVLIINALISLSGFVSLGGHVGGFVVGLVLGALIFGVKPGQQPILHKTETAYVVTLIVGAVLAVAAGLLA